MIFHFIEVKKTQGSQNQFKLLEQKYAALSSTQAKVNLLSEITDYKLMIELSPRDKNLM